MAFFLQFTASSIEIEDLQGLLPGKNEQGDDRNQNHPLQGKWRELKVVGDYWHTEG